MNKIKDSRMIHPNTLDGQMANPAGQREKPARAWRQTAIAVLGLAVSCSVGMCIIALTMNLSMQYRGVAMWEWVDLPSELIVAAGWIVTVFAFLIVFGLFITWSEGTRHMFPHKIYPFPMDFPSELIQPDDKSGALFTRADDEFLELTDQNRAALKPLGIVTLFLAVGMIVTFHGEEKIETGTGVFLAGFLISLTGFIYQISLPVKKIIFDRMNGMVTMSGPLLFPARTFSFDKIVPGYSYSGRLVFCYSRYFRLLSRDVGIYSLSTWSFYVQYMDKNRPLPRGTGFDRWREKDFKRRQAEGFPSPRYENLLWLSDAYTGYIYGTDELKEKISTFKVRYRAAYDKVNWHCKDHPDKFPITNDNDIVWVGTWQDNYVFRLFVPEHEKIVVFDPDEPQCDCFLVHGQKKTLKYVSPQKR